MSDAPETRLTDPRPNPGALLVPVASPSEVLAAQEQVRALVQQTLKKDRDYGIIPGTKKPTLLKPGAERINAAFGVAVRYKIVASEIDHDRPVAWTKRKAQYKSGKFVGYEEISGNSVGLYRYVVDCELIQRAPGVIIGQGIGSCSTMESKYVDRPREVENTILKIAEKRGLIAATLNAYGLSDQFTQDMEDAEPLPSGNEGVDDAPASIPSLGRPALSVAARCGITARIRRTPERPIISARTRPATARSGRASGRRKRHPLRTSITATRRLRRGNRLRGCAMHAG